MTNMTLGNETYPPPPPGGDGSVSVPIPSAGVIYMWYSGNYTNMDALWAAPLRVAVNELDFRGEVPFVYYHQVVSSIAVENSTEYQMHSLDGSSEYAGGSPGGGYPITIIGSGFDGYDNNASTVRVRFTTEVQIGAGEAGMGAAGAGTASDGMGMANNSTNMTVMGNATNSSSSSSSWEVAAVVEVGAVELAPDYVVVIAPSLSVSEGDVINERAYPCWNPPCRRTVVTVAINGVDFVGRLSPLEFYFFEEPWRFLFLMEKELAMLLLILCTVALINALVTWRYRFEVYDRYLRLKYRYKNRVLFPMVFKLHEKL